MHKYFSVVIFLLFAFGGPKAAAAQQATPGWFDQSHEIFLPYKLNTMVSHYRNFPLFWWNFLVIEGQPQVADIEGLCTELENGDFGIQKLPCHFSLKTLQELTQHWLRDFTLRQAFPGGPELKRQMDETLLKASLPIGRDMLNLLRADPLNSLNDLKARLERRMGLDLKLKGGLLIDEVSKRILLPLQFSFPPSEAQRTQTFVASLTALCNRVPKCSDLRLFGVHASTLENEAQIRKDVDAVARAGLVALGLLCLFIVVTRRQHLLNLLPLLAVSIAIAVWVTALVFGKIHGITLAFGPGIVGLSMDYGIHACFLGPRSRKTWRANWVGLWTTIVIMILLGFSSIPLLRQMMFFSVFGLCLSYLIFYVVMRRWPQFFSTTFYRFSPTTWGIFPPIAMLMLAAAPLIFVPTLHLDVQHLNFASAKTIELSQWFFKLTGNVSPHLVIENQAAPLDSSNAYKKWAAERDIPYEGIANYLPPPHDQSTYVESWQRAWCATPGQRFSVTATEARFFAPFFNHMNCDQLSANSLTQHVPDYLKDFFHGKTFVGLFFPRDDNQSAILRQRYAEVSTIREIFAGFPRIFATELLWMIPVAWLGALFFLWLHYRHVGWSLLAVVPFLTGLGCYAAMSLVFNIPLSFVSLIGLLMVFGCSLDYGVFVMDFLLFRNDQEDRPGVWSALSLCCFATIAGFAPLVFAEHPVLRDLGHALTWGTVGTLIGSLWGVPWVYSLARKWRELGT